MRCLTIAFLASFIALCYGQSHDLYVGQASFPDVVLYKVNKYKYGFPLFIRESIVEYPKPGQQNVAYISAVHVKDHRTDGSGGYATISGGGAGQRFVKIKLKSQRGSGFNFTITIYGRY